MEALRQKRAACMVPRGLMRGRMWYGRVPSHGFATDLTKIQRRTIQRACIAVNSPKGHKMAPLRRR